jgi:hypothetical protein
LEGAPADEKEVKSVQKPPIYSLRIEMGVSGHFFTSFALAVYLQEFL